MDRLHKFFTDPTAQTVIAVIAAILGALVSGTLTFPDDIPASVVGHVKSWGAFVLGLYAIANAYMTGTSRGPGPWANTTVPPKIMAWLVIIGLGLVAGLSLSACNSSVSKADAQALSASFCQTYLPAVAPVIGDFNAQVRADYKTASTACKMMADGRSVNVVTVGLAALALYEGIAATYPKLGALSDHDLATARRLAGRDIGGIR